MSLIGVKKSVEAAADAGLANPDKPGLAGSPDTLDSELVSQCQNGDPAAFEQLVGRYQDRVFNLVYRLAGHYQEAQDITQDVFLRALEHIGSFRQQAQVYTWLFRIAVNLAISRRRRHQRLRFVPLEAAAGGQDNDGEATAGDPQNPRQQRPEELAEQDERQRQVARAVAELDEEFRSVLVLKDIEGLDYQEIADVLELPLGTVKSRLHRARSELRARLRPMME